MTDDERYTMKQALIALQSYPCISLAANFFIADHAIECLQITLNEKPFNPLPANKLTIKPRFIKRKFLIDNSTLWCCISKYGTGWGDTCAEALDDWNRAMEEDAGLHQ